MIATNFEDYPYHRTHFYALLKELNQHCFVSLWSAPPEAQKQIVDAVVWGFKHTDREIADCSLEVLHRLLLNVSTHGSDVSQSFYARFLLPLIQDLLFVLTDRLHKSGFKLHATLLRDIFALVNEGAVRVPLFDPAQFPPGTTNAAFLRDFIVNMLCAAFPNVGRAHVDQFVVGLFARVDLNVFKQSVRDFLITLKEFSAEDNSDLFAEENEARARAAHQAVLAQRLAVPGLLTQAERDDMADL